MRTLFAAALAALVAAPVVADETTGLVLAHDRLSNVLVLTDLTVWSLPSDLMIPADLGAGDRVILTFNSEGEDGISTIDALERTAIALPAGTDGGS
ncbi:hypothetical protein [Cognatishimia sp. F0-27]|uniref:hypothetical protein n=1 Tax=Cognatishimia sp. F0-27 TaxID=2816855 RepID=UPI001D0C86C5|nr:hypothetical protein [Cognatishimia sp. F0-27]MCC1494695.1 hypothetical protein [Cognatishimia sp. F0-27]